LGDDHPKPDASAAHHTSENGILTKEWRQLFAVATLV